MEKSRAATNQANARAAYAAATSQFLLDDKSEATTYTYVTTEGKIDADATAATVKVGGDNATDISKCDKSTTVGNSNLGKTVFTTWTVKLGADGVVTEYDAAE